MYDAGTGNSFKGKGTFSDIQVSEIDGKTKVEYIYNIKEGDNGVFYTGIGAICDIAGNIFDKDWGYENTFTTTNKTPYAVSATVDIKTKKEGTTEDNALTGRDPNSRYLRAGKIIRIGIWYNEPVYKDNKKATLEKGTAYVTITFKNNKTYEEADKQAKLVEWSDDYKYLVYEYEIQDGDRRR